MKFDTFDTHAKNTKYLNFIFIVMSLGVDCLIAIEIVWFRSCSSHFVYFYLGKADWRHSVRVKTMIWNRCCVLLAQLLQNSTMKEEKTIEWTCVSGIIKRWILDVIVMYTVPLGIDTGMKNRSRAMKTLFKELLLPARVFVLSNNISLKFYFSAF